MSLETPALLLIAKGVYTPDLYNLSFYIGAAPILVCLRV
jgi:hypothetical protein